MSLLLVPAALFSLTFGAITLMGARVLRGEGQETSSLVETCAGIMVILNVGALISLAL